MPGGSKKIVTRKVGLNIESKHITKVNNNQGEVNLVENEYKDEASLAAANKFFSELEKDNKQIYDLDEVKKKYEAAPNKNQLSFIKYYIESMEAIDNRQQAIKDASEKDKKLSKVETKVDEVKVGDKTHKKIAIKQSQVQATANGCYSVVLSDMLRAKGVDVDQQTIRFYMDKDRVLDAKKEGENNSTYFQDAPRDMFGYKSFVDKVVPNAGMHKRTILVGKELSDVINANKISVNNDKNTIIEYDQLSELFKEKYKDRFDNKVKELTEKALQEKADADIAKEYEILDKDIKKVNAQVRNNNEKIVYKSNLTKEKAHELIKKGSEQLFKSSFGKHPDAKKGELKFDYDKYIKNPDKYVFQGVPNGQSGQTLAKLEMAHITEGLSAFIVPGEKVTTEEEIKDKLDKSRNRLVPKNIFSKKFQKAEEELSNEISDFLTDNVYELTVVDEKNNEIAPIEPKVEENKKYELTEDEKKAVERQALEALLDDDTIKEFNLLVELDEVNKGRNDKLTLEQYKQQKQEAQVKMAEFDIKLKKTVEAAIESKSTMAFNTGGHYISITGYGDDGFYYMDPLEFNEEGNGEPKYTTYADFRKELFARNDINEHTGFDTMWLDDYSLVKEKSKDDQSKEVVKCPQIETLKNTKLTDDNKILITANDVDDKVNDVLKKKYTSTGDNTVQIIDYEGGFSDEIRLPSGPILEHESYKSLDNYYDEKVYKDKPEELVDSKIYTNNRYADFIKSMDDKIMQHGFLDGFEFKNVPAMQDGDRIVYGEYEPSTVMGADYMRNIDKMAGSEDLKDALVSILHLKECIDKFKNAASNNEKVDYKELNNSINTQLNNISGKLSSYKNNSPEKNTLHYNNAINLLNEVNNAIGKQASVTDELNTYKLVYAMKNKLKLFDDAEKEYNAANEVKNNAQAKRFEATNKYIEASEALEKYKKEIDATDISNNMLIAQNILLERQENLADNKSRQKELKADIEKSIEDYCKENQIDNNPDQISEGHSKKIDELTKDKKNEIAKLKEEEKTISKELPELQKQYKNSKTEYDDKFGKKLNELERNKGKAFLAKSRAEQAYNNALSDFNLKEMQYKQEKGKLNESLEESKAIKKIIGGKNEEIRQHANGLLAMCQGVHRATSLYKLKNSDEYMNFRDAAWGVYDFINPEFHKVKGPKAPTNLGLVTDKIFDDNGNLKKIKDKNGNDVTFKDVIAKLKKESMNYIVHATTDDKGRQKTPSSNYGKIRLQGAINLNNFCNEMEKLIDERQKLSKMDPIDLIKNSNDVVKDNEIGDKLRNIKSMDALNAKSQNNIVTKKNIVTRKEHIVYEKTDPKNSNVLNFKQLTEQYENEVNSKKAKIKEKNNSKPKKIEEPIKNPKVKNNLGNELK